jgi:hypothetical protein
LNEACLLDNNEHAVYCFVGKLFKEKENDNILATQPVAINWS